MSEQPRGSVTKQPRKYWLLAVVVLIYVLLAVFYSYLTPPFEGPDEPQHFAYVTWLAAGKGLPPQGEAAWATPLEQEAGQTPLYYLAASLPARLIDLEEATADYVPNPYFPGPAIGNSFDNDNQALHYAADGRPLQGEWLALYLARLVTLLFGVVLVVGVYALATLVKPAQPAFALSAAALVAFTPQVIFLSGVVSNDIPAAALSTLALLFMALLLRRAPDQVNSLAFLVGLFIGLAAMAKINALLLVVPAGVTLLLVWRGGASRAGSGTVTAPTGKDPAGSASTGNGLKQTVWAAMMMVVGLLLVSGWWFVRGAVLFGAPLGVNTHDYAPWAVTDPQSLATPLARWLEVGRFYWLTLGWGTIRPENWVYAVLLIFTILAVVGLAVAFVHWWRARRFALGPAAAILLVLLITFLANVLLLEVWMNRVIAPYGRLLFTSIGAITILLAAGWHAIHRRFVLLPLIFVGALAVATPFLLLKPAYSASFVDVQKLPPALGWQFGATDAEPIVELISVEPARYSVFNDDALSVRVCWRVLRQTEKEHVFFLQIIGPDNSLVSDSHSYPGEGMLLSSQWRPDDVFCDDMHIRLQAAWAPTLVYQLEVGVTDEATGERLVPTDGQGNILPTTLVARIRVAEPAPEEQMSEAPPGHGPVQLLASELDPGPWKPQETYAYNVSWSAVTPLEEEYHLFVHLRDGDTGAIVAQADRPPLDGWYPTSWWPVGEIIHDEGQITVPADLAAGTYDLVVGFYDLTTSQPLVEEFVLGSTQVAP